MEQHLFKYNQTFELESGETLPRIKLSYSTLGSLNSDKSNVIWVCHALTANSEPEEWWEGLIGKNKLFNPEKHFIICVNMLGSCYGSTGPLDTNPNTQDLYYLDFPQVTVRDMVAGLDLLRQDLGIEKIGFCIGGSMGGQQALEWSISQPELIENLILLATNAKHSPWGIAFNESQRLALLADPTFKDNDPNAGKAGLKAARSTALLSYRNYEAYWNTQSETDIEKTDHYRATSYQQYQGDKLVERFNAHAYWYLLKAMDSHHVGRSRGGIQKALAIVKANTLVIGIKSDYLFPTSEQRTIAENIQGGIYEEIDSFYGHDGFLIETKAITEIINEFLITKSVNL